MTLAWQMEYAADAGRHGSSTPSVRARTGRERFTAVVCFGEIVGWWEGCEGKSIEPIDGCAGKSVKCNGLRA